MAAKKQALGRSLSSLLSEVTKTSPQENPSNEQLCHLPIEVIQPGSYQPRQNFDKDALQELADSIRAQGIIQPIIVRRILQGKYEIVAGERRWRAAQLAEFSEVPVIIRNIPDEVAIAMALIENIQRENLNPLEEANALQRLLDEFAMTHQEIASAIGKSRAAVTNLLRLHGLNADVKQLLAHGQLEMGHARALLALAGAAQTQAAKIVVAKELTVRETESLVRRMHTQAGKPNASKKYDPNIHHLQTNLSEKLGAIVKIQHGAKGKGKLVIHYHSVAELDGILAHIQ